MERKQNSGSFRGGVAKRLLSLMLALALVLSLMPAIGLFNIQVSAATTQTIYFKNSDGWGSVYGYAWDNSQNQLLGAWPGTKLSKDSTGYYKMSVSVNGSLNFIFNNGSGGEGNQTGDLSLTSAQLSSGNAYVVDGISGSPAAYTPPVVSNGKATFTYVGSATKVLLAGTMNGWSGVAMNKSGNTFTYTYDLEPGMYEYKFVVDGNWISDPSNPNVTGSDNNSYIVVSGSSASATSNTVKIHFQNTLGWGTVCGVAWTTVGSVSSAIDGWSWPGQLLQKDADGNYLLEVTPNLVSGQSMGYLFHDFDSQQTVDLSIDYTTLSKGNVELWVKPTTANDEGKYACSTATSFTPSPKVEGNKVTFTYTGSATSVAVAGSFNSWSTSAAKMTKSGTTFTYTTTLADGIYEYKFVVNGSTWITDPSNGTVAGADGNSILIVGDTVANTDASKITVQFHVTKTGSYTGWDAWVWNDFDSGTAYTLKTGTLSDKLVSVTVDGTASYVGFILRKSDWSSQDDTYYVDLKNITSGTVHCFVDYAKSAMTQINDKDVQICGGVSYAKMDYQSNIIWVKTTAPVDLSAAKFTDANGKTSDVTITGYAAEGFGYNLSLSRMVTLDELSNLRVYLNGSDCKIEPNDYLFYSSRFASEYTYNGDDLGATWTKTGTTFKVWAPTAWKMQVVRYKTGRWDGTWIETVDMTRGANGTWTVTIPGDLNGTYYNYVAHFAGYTTEAVDPYAKSTGPNSDRSMVLDMTSTNPSGWDNDISPNQGMTYTDAIIYEMHVREMTIDSTSGVKAEWRGKFLGMTQEGTNYQGRATGLDHLKELGVTHVQLMPVYDFGWPDEYNLGGTDYSWGYNPRHFNVPEGSYSTNPEKGEVRVNEMKQMVQAFHSNGINVIMDVVYNHLDSAGDFCYNKLVPYYFTRFWDKNGDWGSVCNGSGVGNDFATQRSMARNYIVDSLSWWVEEYHVDGFRFDLAGLIDTQTMNEAIAVIQAKYPSVIFYGEGWDNYGTNMEGYDTTTQYNSWMVPGFGFFNNTLRDALGGNESKDNGEWGFAMGSSEKAETVMYSMRGINSWSSNPNQTINYISCHDGYTLTDKICTKRGGAYWSEIAAMNRLAGATILLSQGIPMIYSGDEILREKIAPAGWRAHNSGHESGVDLDALNSIKWNELVSKDYAQVNDDYYAGLIEFRKNHSALRCSFIDNGTPDAQKYTSAHRVSDQCILIYVDGYPNYECSDGIVIILNSGSGTQWVNFYDYGVPYGNWQATIHGDKAGNTALWSTSDGAVGVEGYSATVLVKGDLIDENSVYNRQSTNSGCRHTVHDENGICANCGASVSHTYTSGTCTVCGKIQPGSNTSSTIYVDLSGTTWSKVNVYTWDDASVAITGSWPGSPMTKVEGSVYSYEVPGSAVNIIFNDGTNQTADLVIPTDGKNLYNLSTKTWSTYGEDDNGGGDVVTPGTTYYLIGYINGANYGCEEDYKNMGSYKFADGKLETRFAADSYVFLKTEGNGKWYLTESYCTDTTANFVIGGTEKMFVPGGKDLVFTLTENADGSLTLSYAEATAECKHAYNSGVTTKEPSCGVAGETTYTCTLCGHSYVEPLAALTHSYSEKVTMPASCTNPGAKIVTCMLCGDSYTEAVPATGHSFANGSCSVCGTTDPSTVPTTYYLVGYINGANYGCEEDYENVGSYKFVDGKLTATFTTDSYLFVKTGDNTKWMMANEFCEGTTCTFAEGGSEKMLVPGNVELIFTLTENEDGSVTVSYTTGAVVPSTVPTLTLKAPTLEFKDMITVNAFYTAENIDDVVEMGMITYSTKVSTVDIATAENVIPGAEYEPVSGRYYSCSQGIHAKFLGDTVYLAIYAKLKDGTYAYSKLASYSAVTYATNQLKNSTNTALKQLVAAMLNYGAEAQLYFNHNTSALANATLTEEQKALPEVYNSGMVSAVPSASATKQGSFANNQGFASKKPAISFEGAFCINYFFTPNYAPDNGITLYYWNAADFNAASVLTTANATGSIKLTGTGVGEYRGDIEGISAKDLSAAVYVAAVYENGGTTWTSGVLGYSIGAYCSSQASKGGTIADLAKATAVYGYHAKAYFG